MSNPLSNPLSNPMPNTMPNPMQNPQFTRNNYQQSNPLSYNPNNSFNNPNNSFNQPQPNYPPNYNQPQPNYPPNYNLPQPNYPPNYNQPQPNYPPNYNLPQPNYPPNYNQPQPNLPPNYNNQQQPNLPPNLNSDVVNPRINDPELYHAMKRVVEIQKGKKLYDAMPDTNIGKEQKEIEEELARKEEEEKKKKEEEENLLSQQQIPQQPQAIQNAFKNLFNKDMIRNNSIRRLLLYITIILISIYSMMWEFLCLFNNVCFGEEQEVEKWISHCICPLFFLLIILVTLLYFFSDYIYKPGIKITNIFITLASIACVVIGIIGLIILARKSTKDNCHGLQDIWDLLTENERIYYDINSKDCNKLWKKYRQKMLLSNIFLIVAGGIGILLALYSFCFYWMLTDTAFDWRPPMRSHLHDDRAKRIIDLYFKNNEEFRRLYEAEHNKEIDEQLKLFQQSMGMNNDVNNINSIQGGGNDDNEGFELPMVSKNKNQAGEDTSLKNDVDNNNIINNQENNNNNLINNQENNNNNTDNNIISNQDNNENKKKRTIPKRHVKQNEDKQQ